MDLSLLLWLDHHNWGFERVCLLCASVCVVVRAILARVCSWCSSVLASPTHSRSVRQRRGFLRFGQARGQTHALPHHKLNALVILNQSTINGGGVLAQAAAVVGPWMPPPSTHPFFRSAKQSNLKSQTSKHTHNTTRLLSRSGGVVVGAPASLLSSSPPNGAAAARARAPAVVAPRSIDLGGSTMTGSLPRRRGPSPLFLLLLLLLLHLVSGPLRVHAAKLQGGSALALAGKNCVVLAMDQRVGTRYVKLHCERCNGGVMSILSSPQLLLTTPIKTTQRAAAPGRRRRRGREPARAQGPCVTIYV
jgi:hypothetical protein